MDEQLRALKWRAWHRGTKEADLMIGGFYDAHHQSWNEAQMAWFSDLLAEQDVDIMAWGIGTLPVPEHFEGEMMDAFRKLDFLPIAR
jgi:antitoxin CptB